VRDQTKAGSADQIPGKTASLAQRRRGRPSFPPKSRESKGRREVFPRKKKRKYGTHAFTGTRAKKGSRKRKRFQPAEKRKN